MKTKAKQNEMTELTKTNSNCPHANANEMCSYKLAVCCFVHAPYGLACLLLCYTMRRPFDYLSIDAYQL